MKKNTYKIPNKFHLYIQTKYRAIIQENKKKYNKHKNKEKSKREIKEYL